MPTHLIRHVVIGTVALVGLLLVAASAWILFPMRMVVPEDLLPAERTALFVRVQSPADRDALKAWLPLLRDIEELPPPFAAALLTFDDGGAAWAVFPPADPRSRPVPQSGDPRALALLAATPASPLRTNPGYASLSTAFPTAASAAFLQPNLLSGSSLLPAWATHLPPFSLTLDGQRLHVALRADPPRMATLPQRAARAFAEPILSIAAGDMSIARSVWQRMDREQRLAASALFDATVRDVLGPDASPLYDVLPLLGERTTVHVATGSGVVQWVVQGTANQGTAAALEALHDVFARNLSAIAEETRTFADGFEETHLRVDADAVERLEDAVGPWRLRTTRRGVARAFVTGMSGDQFVLGTDPTAVRNLLEGRLGAMDLPVPAGTEPVAGGIVDHAAWERWILPVRQGPWPSLPPRFRWSLSLQGPLLLWSMEPA